MCRPHTHALGGEGGTCTAMLVLEWRAFAHIVIATGDGNGVSTTLCCLPLKASHLWHPQINKQRQVRPLTHDVAKNILNSIGGSPLRVPLGVC